MPCTFFATSCVASFRANRLLTGNDYQRLGMLRYAYFINSVTASANLCQIITINAGRRSLSADNISEMLILRRWRYRDAYAYAEAIARPLSFYRCLSLTHVGNAYAMRK